LEIVKSKILAKYVNVDKLHQSSEYLLLLSFSISASFFSLEYGMGGN